jgi:hypothetical protein
MDVLQLRDRRTGAARFFRTRVFTAQTQEDIRTW